MQLLLKLLDSDMIAPTNYGWFHLMFIGIVILTTFLFCYFFKDASNKTFNRISLICWIIIVILELYKQFVFSYTFGENTVTWDYQWYAFPFQFCSSPIYVLPVIIFIKNNKIKEIFVAFMASFSLFAGLAVFIYPNDVFIDTIGINIQTMIHHGLQIVLGVFFAVYYRNSLNIKWWLKSILVFVGLVIVALGLNLIVHNILQANNIDKTFNMFYISPYFECTLPVLSIFYDLLPYALFLILYIVGFAIAAFVVFIITSTIINFVRKKKIANA